jgi:hypothetical protein
MAIGVSFLPGQQQGQAGAGTGTADPQEAVSQAIKILSLRLPRVVGANAIAPQALLTAPGAAGVNSGGMNIDRLVQMILQGLVPGGGGSQAPGAGPSVPGAAGISPTLAQIFAQTRPSGAMTGAQTGPPSTGVPAPAAPSPSPWTPRIEPVTDALPTSIVQGPPIAPPVQTTPSQPQQGDGAGLNALFNARRPRV